MREIMDAAAFREMFLCANAALEENKQTINELNVFPVPDGDTGTNMSLTMNAAAIELSKKSHSEIGAAADCVASALLRGARGNSGVILSLLFRGIAKSLKGKECATASDFSAALTAGVDAAYKAVMKPAEGTILTVSRIAALAAVEFAKDNDDMELMFDCLLQAAKGALADTVNQNPVLQRAGVVDAGGEGFVVIMDAMLAWMQGRAAAPVTAAVPAAVPVSGANFSEFDTGEITFAYCTEFIVARENQKSPELLRSFLENLGDCVVVVSDDEIVKVHVHTNVPGDVLTEALTYGPLQTVKIENMRNQHTALSGEAQPDGPEEPAIAPAEKPYGVVTVCAGAGMSEIFQELGADRIVTGGQTMNPSTEDILTEVNKTPAETVFVLPNNKNIIMAAEQCVSLTEKQVVVIPTKTVPQGVSAMLSFDPSGEQAQIVQALTGAAEGVRTVLVTYAARDSDFDGHDIHAGEYLALLDGALIGSFSDFAELLQTVSDTVEDLEPEIISVYYGEDVRETDAEEVGVALENAFPDADVSVVNGGQPVYYYMISIE
ncbi:MAG: DAK2 domain-containing protein [Oscillospiraceae bacterium]|nr:DAK2 domain-containing protein [Oscillospiraceae bacterium]